MELCLCSSFKYDAVQTKFNGNFFTKLEIQIIEASGFFCRSTTSWGCWEVRVWSLSEMAMKEKGDSKMKMKMVTDLTSLSTITISSKCWSSPTRGDNANLFFGSLKRSEALFSLFVQLLPWRNENTNSAVPLLLRRADWMTITCSFICIKASLAMPQASNILHLIHHADGVLELVGWVSGVGIKSSTQWYKSCSPLKRSHNVSTVGWLDDCDGDKALHNVSSTCSTDPQL